MYTFYVKSFLIFFILITCIVVMQPLFTISTSCYFRSESSPTDHAPNRSPRPNRKTSSEKKTIHEEPPTSATPTSAPPIPILSPPVPDVNIIEEPDSETTPISDAPTPSSEAPPLLGGTSSPNSVSRKSVISREKKSFLKKHLSRRKRKKGPSRPTLRAGQGVRPRHPTIQRVLMGLKMVLFLTKTPIKVRQNPNTSHFSRVRNHRIV